MTTHNPQLQRGLVVEEKYVRVAHYAMDMNREIDMIAHGCGVRQARELARRHVRIVQANGGSIALDVPYPDPRGAAPRHLARARSQLGAPDKAPLIAHG